MALPEAQQKLSHGEPTWFAGKGKVFAIFDDRHHGAARVDLRRRSIVAKIAGSLEFLLETDRPGRESAHYDVGAARLHHPLEPVIAVLTHDRHRRGT